MRRPGPRARPGLRTSDQRAGKRNARSRSTDGWGRQRRWGEQGPDRRDGEDPVVSIDHRGERPASGHVVESQRAAVDGPGSLEDRIAGRILADQFPIIPAVDAARVIALDGEDAVAG